MDNSIAVALISAITSSGMCSLILYILQRRDKKKDEENDKVKAQTRMLLGLAHECIINKGEMYIKRGSISRQEYEDLSKYLYNPYTELGGNGTAEKIMKKVEELPFRPLEEID